MVTFDGGYDSNSGNGGSGWVVYRLPAWNILSFGCDYSADLASNNVEEYRGLINGLKSVSMLSLSPFDQIVVLGDSQLVINQLCGDYNCGTQLSYLLEIALTYLQSSKFICRWIPREWNGAADLLSREARRLKHWPDPLQAKSMLEWRKQLLSLTVELQHRSKSLGPPKAALNLQWAVAIRVVHRHYLLVVKEFMCFAGNRKRNCMELLPPWLHAVVAAAEGTTLLPLGSSPRWKNASLNGVRVQPTTVPIATSVQDSDMQAIIRAADFATDLIRRKHWDVGKAVRELREETWGGRPNADLNPSLYVKCLKNYPQLSMMCHIAEHGVNVLLDPSFRPRRPWMRNLPIATEAINVAINKIVSEYNKGRGIIVHSNIIGRNCPRLTVSPMGAVKKGNEPLCENVRVINALSSPKDHSINSATINVIPDACFGKVSEIADEVLRLRLLHPPSVKIMAMGADIDSAFKHIPKSADAVELFAVIIPGTSFMWLSFNLDFGWKGSPGYFALFAKAVRHQQSAGGSYIQGKWYNFYVFVWVDDIILVEPDIGDRILLAETRLRTSVEQVFGPAAWKESKFETWTTKWTALGLMWDSSSCTVEMPIAKLDKAAVLIQSMLLLGSTTLRDLRSLLGQLRHLSTCVPAACSFVQEVQLLVNTHVASSPEYVLQLQPGVRADLSFWQANLLNTNFTAWPMELFGTVGTNAATWTLCVLRGRACVYWHEAAVTWINDGRLPVSFSTTVRAISWAFRAWRHKIISLGIRAPRILLLVPRSSWAVAINGGQNAFSDGRRVMQQLALIQLEFRVHFKAIHWKSSGNEIPASWRQAVRMIENITTNNVISQLDSLQPLTSGKTNWLCRLCAQALENNTKSALNPGSSSRPPSTSLSGSMISPTSNRRQLSPGLWPSSPRSASTLGQQLKERLVQFDGCTVCTAKWTWSSNIQSSPWWGTAASARSHALGPGSQ